MVNVSNASQTVADAAIEEVERLRAALLEIQRSANDSHPTAIWMQKVAAHALHPKQWPAPGAPVKRPVDPMREMIDRKMAHLIDAYNKKNTQYE